MNPGRGLLDLIARLNRTLGPPGVMIGAFSLLSFLFGLLVLAREYDRQGASTRDTLRQLIGRWVKTASADYLRRQTLVDVAANWRRAAPEEREDRLRSVRRALNELGEEFTRQAERTPWLDVVAMDLVDRGGGPPLATWRSRSSRVGESRLIDAIPVLPADGTGPAIELSVRYRVAPEIDQALGGMEASYRRVLLAILGLSGYSLLCFGYMILHARNLRERVAREAAQQATLDLADRTCHELGNIVFILANERRNLADHLDLIEQFTTQQAEAHARAAQRVGLDAPLANRLRQALDREYADRGIDPTLEIPGSVAIARDVCRQIEVCSHYIALTLRELDTYLKESSLTLQAAPVPFSCCLDDALALLGPRLESARAQVHRPETDAILQADRRLLVHALVNLLKNALEATTEAGISPVLTLSLAREGPMARIEVRDNGPGIPKALRPHLFKPGHSTKGSGRGRGLAIVHNSILAQGGEIECVASPSGTTFHIHLPLEPTPSPT